MQSRLIILHAQPGQRRRSIELRGNERDWPDSPEECNIRLYSTVVYGAEFPKAKRSNCF